MEVYNSSRTAAEMEYALGAVPSIGENGNWFIGEEDTGIFAKGINVTGAEVGQTVKVAAVDENGVPTAWEAIALPKGEAKSVAKITLEAQATGFEFSNLNLDNQALSLRIYSVGSAAGNGIKITVNGVTYTAYRGSLKNDKVTTLWLFLTEDGCRVMGGLDSEYLTSYVCDTVLTGVTSPINSIKISGPYINGTDYYYDVGATVELWEGVCPLVGNVHNL